ncbi:MAG: HAD-IA family hydrolase [Chitinophagaceae bacterium]|nr:HAD-IA family hydrolase [Chitinophagaceae bacterium]
MMIRGILFDFIGTTVLEKDPQVINRCFSQAFSDHGVTISQDFIRNNRGKDKKEVITRALIQGGYRAELIPSVLASLESYVAKNISNFSVGPGAREIIEHFISKDRLVGLGSGLPRETFDRILHYLEWENIPFHYIGIAAEMERGRPHPDMIIDMMQKLGLQPREVLKVGDTTADILEGKNAGVFTAAILSGTQATKLLAEQQPDWMITSLSELKEIVINDVHLQPKI